MLKQPIGGLAITFLDLETTGLSTAAGHRICEIALLRVRGSVVEYAYETLVNPQRPLDKQAAAINGLSAEMLIDAPSFAAVAASMLQITSDSVLVAHNAPFDISFLAAELRTLQLAPLRNYVIDTLSIARRLLRVPSYSLPYLADYLQLAPPSHRAMQDVRSLRGLFAFLLAQLDALNITTLGAVLRFERGLLPGDPEPSAPPIILRALHEHRRLRIVYRSRSTPNPVARTILPLALTQERRGVHLRAYCYLRQDMRSFVIDKMEQIELEN
ncbi:MAG: WYL domain-containing protein [Chloroflexaceae bacterium]|nr:WYL domain-containing protein [Chloroflexaceae bacterium]NJO07137.1 WYL domain-containing protein [Chloroflexaceae bacterium]